MLDDALIHNRALGAVARITLTFGSVCTALGTAGCIETAEDGEATQVSLIDEDGTVALDAPDSGNEESPDMAMALAVEEDAAVNLALDAGSVVVPDAAEWLEADAAEFEPDAAEFEPDAAEFEPDAAELPPPTADCLEAQKAGNTEWSECCDAVNWDWQVPGCMAWGPSVPPAMPVAA